MNTPPPSSRALDAGLLLLRLGVGAAFVAHGLPKLLAGPEMWTKLGGSMALLGLDFAPTFWGLMAAVAEGVGGVLLALGLLTRPTAAMMTFTMVVAAVVHLSKGDGFGGASHAMELGVVFASLILIGPGRFSLDAKLAGSGLLPGWLAPTASAAH
ncbi:DoxX family protein [Myxococcaceae bacterium GXIMD 01537]